MKIKLKGICININKSRNINKLELLKELCLNELTNKDTYKPSRTSDEQVEMPQSRM